jgi:uncharacterized protein YbbC (DUF1343 family)
VSVAGPVLDAAARSFVNHHPLPVRHGMTMGELAELFNADLHMGAALEVVRMQGWRREADFDATGLPWVNPSPNLRSTTETLLYPGVALLEGTNVSVGRGTETPFEVVGAPWIDGGALSSALSQLALGGVSFAPASFTPTSSTFHGEASNGVRITLTDRALFEPVRLGVGLARELRRLYPGRWHFEDVDKLLQNKRALSAIDRRDSIAQIEATWADDLAAFRLRREKYLLYPATHCPR